MTAATPATSPHRPGLLVLHGNRLEHLAEAVFAWLADNPLAPLEEEVLLVQSNGMAEWLKMELARAHGICAAARVELPARFIWRAYRAVLGREAVPHLLPLDKLPLTWRLMRLLAELEERAAADVPAAYAPLAGFLRRGDAPRRHQLALRLADLFDQYQVYRSDWLEDWAAGVDRLRRLRQHGDTEVPEMQRWQPALWRAVLAGLGEGELQATRPRLHRRFLDALRVPQAGQTNGQVKAPPQGLQQVPLQGPLTGQHGTLPRRIVLFGTTHLPYQTLEALAALSRHVQVLMAVPNPCRWYWADLIDGRELLRAARRRHPLRGGRELAQVQPEDLHAHGHPLLAAWGRQSRDFVRLLDEFDDVQAARERFPVKRVDLFDDAPATTLLAQVQERIRELVPLAEHAKTAVAPADRSVVFHIAHGAQREVEILHDRLLHLLAHPPGEPAGPGESGAPAPLAPRDIVVMVPDIDAFAPAIRSVFGQHARGHARHIPWAIADQRERGRQPLHVALEWLLRAPHQRFTFSELRDLFDVPALARRFGLGAEDVRQLVQWAEGAGVRWGLHEAQRGALGLEACGDVNTWHFGLRRMLLGFATGELALDGGGQGDGVGDGFGDGQGDRQGDGQSGGQSGGQSDAQSDAPQGAHAENRAGIEPYAEVAGPSAGLAGALAEVLGVLEAWWADQARPRPPAAWSERLRELMQAVFHATDDAERALLAALDEALAGWLQACEAAGFEAPLELAVVREAWLAALEAPGLSKRFKAGGVTFCTLLPLRAIPFEVVCLLGMNEGDYPRRNARSDFDLMALAGQARPGDRSRRDDDRQLMLDALLSARRVLYVSWAGRSQRDNQVQPPSVLVAQLRDYLEAGWGAEVVKRRTTEHPLQPFGRRYFEVQPGEGKGEVNGAVNGAVNGEEKGEPLFTYAAEWRSAHEAAPTMDLERGEAIEASERRAAGTRAAAESAPAPITLDQLARFLRNPVKEFFRQRLRVRLDEIGPAALDDEAFVSAGLERWRLLDEVLRGTSAALDELASADEVEHHVQRHLGRLKRAGHLPLGGPGRHAAAELMRTLVPMVQQRLELQSTHPRLLGRPLVRLAVDASRPDLVLEDTLPLLRGTGVEGELPLWIELQASALVDKKIQRPRPDKLVLAWLRDLAATASGHVVRGVMVGADARVHLAPRGAEGALTSQAARETLFDLMHALREGLAGGMPFPTAVRTGLAFLGENPGLARGIYEGNPHRGVRGEGHEASLARLAPDFASLVARPGFETATRRLYAPYQAWLASHVTVEELPGRAELDDEDDEGRDGRGSRSGNESDE